LKSLAIPSAPAAWAAKLNSDFEKAGRSRFSELNEVRRNEALRSCPNVADTLCPGLDLTEEILATHAVWSLWSSLSLSKGEKRFAGSVLLGINILF
jgi:hypothetical protein